MPMFYEYAKPSCDCEALSDLDGMCLSSIEGEEDDVDTKQQEEEDSFIQHHLDDFLPL